MTTVTPCCSSSRSPSAAPVSKPSPYWKPEQPPPWIAIRRTPTSASSARSCLIFVAAASVSETSGVAVRRSWISVISAIVATCPAGTRGADFVTVDSRLTTRFLSIFVPVNRREKTRDARQLAAVPHLRHVRDSHPLDHDGDELRVRPAPGAPAALANGAVRVGRVDGTVEDAALHRQLLPHGDAVHPLRYRDRLPVSACGDPPPARMVRVYRVPLLHRHPRARVRLRLAEGSPRMAVERDKRLADYGLHSERVVWRGKGPGKFEEELGDLERRLGITTLAKAVRWAQTKSMWPDTFGLACCAIEMMSIVSARYDIARFGMEAFRSSPRQADLLIVSGRVSQKMAAPLREIYDQMLEPKWVIAMGACASSAGMFNNYAVLQGVDKIVPVDVYVPGCPPRPEAVLEGIVRLQERIRAGVPPAYDMRRVAG